MEPFLQLLGFGLVAAAGNLLGGFLITRSNESRQVKLKSLIAIGAGFLLAAIFLEIIPDVAREWKGQLSIPMGWLLAGYLLVQFAEHSLAPHLHLGEGIDPKPMMRRGAGPSVILALSVHTFLDGVIIASGLLTSFRLGLLLFIAILLHKIPEGFTAASVMLSSGRGSRAAWQATILIAGSTLAGIILMTLVKPAVIYTLPFSAGATLYVAASDLIPEVNHKGGARTSLMVLAGVMIFYLIHLVLHEATGE